MDTSKNAGKRSKKLKALGSCSLNVVVGGGESGEGGVEMAMTVSQLFSMLRTTDHPVHIKRSGGAEFKLRKLTDIEKIKTRMVKIRVGGTDCIVNAESAIPFTESEVSDMEPAEIESNTYGTYFFYESGRYGEMTGEPDGMCENYGGQFLAGMYAACDALGLVDGMDDGWTKITVPGGTMSDDGALDGFITRSAESICHPGCIERIDSGSGALYEVPEYYSGTKYILGPALVEKISEFLSTSSDGLKWCLGPMPFRSYACQWMVAGMAAATGGNYSNVVCYRDDMGNVGSFLRNSGYNVCVYKYPGKDRVNLLDISADSVMTDISGYISGKTEGVSKPTSVWMYTLESDDDVYEIEIYGDETVPVCVNGIYI